MKRLVFLFFSAVALMCSCEFQGSHNGDLDGFWLLTQVDTLSNQQSDLCRAKQVFWSFEAHIMKTEQKSDGTTYLYRFCHEGDKLSVYEPHVYKATEGEMLAIDAERLPELYRFGINALDEEFVVEKLNHKHMQLRSSMLRLYFERY